MISKNALATENVLLAEWARGIRRSAIQEMLAIGSRPGILSFALGLPAPELFPAQECAQAAERVLIDQPDALQYSPFFQPLKKNIVRLMSERGVACTEDQVFLTAGAQQGVSLLTRLLLDRSSQVLLEEMAYPGFQQALLPFEPDLLTVSTDLETGMNVDEVERLLKGGARPRLIYAITDGHNPFGISMSRDKRARLVELAVEHRVPIIEEDPYGFLLYEKQQELPMRALNGEWVFYVGSFSKIFAPSMRVGWLIVPEALIPRLSVIKEATDIDTATFTQRVISAYLDAEHLPGHLLILRREYAARRDAMLQALEENFPAEARWTRPSNGVFIWVELPAMVNTEELLGIAVEREKVAFVPGHAFCVSHNLVGANCMRLNFSHSSPERIRDGIARLGRVIETIMERSDGSTGRADTAAKIG